MRYNKTLLPRRNDATPGLRLCGRAALLVLTMTVLASCSMMTDDRSDCPTCYNPLHVVLKYDYNTQRADMFSDHVQKATCYVVDAATNRIVAKDVAENNALAQPLKSRGFAFNFEGLPEGDYRLWAIAETPALLNMEHSTLRHTPLNVGDDIGTLTITTPYAEQPDADGRHAVATHQLDTLWHGMTTAPVHLQPYKAATDTVSLVRNTNNLSLMLAQLTNPTDNYADDYDVRVLDDNAQLGYDNELTTALPLTYRPYAARTIETLGTRADADTVVARTAHFDLSLARLLRHDDATRNARLIISSRKDGKAIVDIDLIHYLTLARSALDAAYPEQEFLDREYDFHLDFVLSGNEWKFMYIRINVLSWSLRIQNEAL